MKKQELLNMIKKLIESLDEGGPAGYSEGQIYRHCSGNIYIVDANLYLVCIQGTSPGNFWSKGKGFDGDEVEFTYLGTANNIVEIKQCQSKKR
jgi:hypothetical protein